MDRRAFLIAAGRIGLAAGAGAVGLTVARAVTPAATARPGVMHRPGESATPTQGRAGTRSGPTGNTAPHANLVRQENAVRGTDRWLIGGLPATIQGYLDRASVAPGDQLALRVDAQTQFDVEWYRLGWYGGSGGRQVRVDSTLPASPGSAPLLDPTTGRSEAPWQPSLALEVPRDWPPGMYTAVLRPRSGNPGYVPFIVRRPPGDSAPVLFVSAALTWQAYNTWGGANLYDASMADSPEISKGRRAVQVSLDRPYEQHQGAGYQQRWELQFVRWQEREGIDVDYAADLDLELDPAILDGRRLVVFAGHHEYWSRPMRTALEAAVASGVNVLFLSANEVYWQVRLEPSPLGPGRRMTCYKSRLLDPLASSQPELTTCRWRERPVDDPEAPLVGQMYGHIVRRPGDWVAAQTDHWLYEGTGLRDGDHLVNLVGQEYDSYFPELANPGTVILARSPIDAVIERGQQVGRYASPAIHNSTMYTASSGATVFAAGTFQWSWALDQFGDRSYRGYATPVDERVVQMTRNLFDRLG
ncbi:MAG TPA: N,N-dimethylformamidase beta subunit family domain-containing protein [Candidatus Limnocylindrales bacterium]